MKPFPQAFARRSSLPSLTAVRKLLYASLSGALLWLGLNQATATAQSVVYSGSQSSLNAGSANLCGPNQSVGPCFKTFSLSYKVTESGTLGQPKVLTQGSPDLDFTLAVTGSTCEGLVTAGTTCTVAVRFTPKYPGVRPGGVLVVDRAGKTLATTLIRGTGVGAQIGFVPGTVTTVDVQEPAPGTPEVDGVAVDGAGDVYAINSVGVVKVTPGGTKTLLPSDFLEDTLEQALALDGAGDLFVCGEIETAGKISALAELPANGVTWVSLPTTANLGLSMAVDYQGNVFLGAASGEAYEEPVGGGAEKTLPFTNLFELYGIAVNVNGDVFVDDTLNLWELPSGSGSPVMIGRLNGFGMASDNLGNIYASDSNADDVLELDPGKNTGMVEAEIGARYEIAVNAAGDIYTTNDTNILLTQRSQLPTFDFGSVAVGSSKTLPLELNNLGNGPLTVVPSFVSPSYKVLGESPSGCLTGLTPRKSCTLSLQFSPQKEGHHKIQLTMRTNGAADTVTLLDGVGIVQ